jgi:hypothetical protein
MAQALGRPVSGTGTGIIGAGTESIGEGDGGVGWRGGGCWPLWVIKVYCELLVQGTFPPAIPSNIGILFERLDGEEPKDLPSINFV